MKTIDEIMDVPRLQLIHTGLDGGMGWACLASTKKENQRASIVFSWGGLWDHVSVSFKNRCPTWEEMCEVKRMFFRDYEVVVQFHPAETEYVNVHPYCLHLWRLQEQDFPTPPTWMVGPKVGETLKQVQNRGLSELEEMEKEK